MKKEAVIRPEDFDFDLNGSFQYSYSLTSRTKNFISKELSIYIKSQIARNLYVITAIAFEFRPTSGSYDFRTDQIQTRTDVTTGEQTQIGASYVFENEERGKNFFGL